MFLCAIYSFPLSELQTLAFKLLIIFLSYFIIGKWLIFFSATARNVSQQMQHFVLESEAAIYH